jgi:hypothetical protein
MITYLKLLVFLIFMNNSAKQYKIKNPQRIAFKRWLLIDALFIFLGINSMINFDINSFDGMFIMLSILITLTSFFFIPLTLKNIKLLDKAIEQGQSIAHWKYSKQEWNDYLKFEKNYRSDESKLIAIVLSVITLIVFIPFILIIPEGKFFMFLVLIGLLVLFFAMGWIIPRITFYLKRNNVGEVILLKKGILLNKQFHTWDFPLSKFNNATIVKEPYRHLIVVYDFVDRTGLRSYAVNIPIPKKNRQDIKKIISSFE